jgi:serine/threonine-protein kinase
MTDIPGIPGSENFTKVEFINKGWSEDKKYYIETIDSQRLFLRISDITEYDRKKAEYDMMERVYTLGVLTPQPIDFGFCNDGKSVYSLSCWLDGEDAEKVLPQLMETEQYILGIKAGELLRNIHSILAPADTEDWAVRFDRKVKYWLDKYNSKPEVHSETGEMIIKYLKDNCYILEARPQTFIHGDYNTENIMVMPNGKVGVIDFNINNTSYGDPWWDMDNMSWMPKMFPYFYTGQIRGYFNGDTPAEFWGVLTYYWAYDALAALTDPYGLNGIENGTEIVNNILKWTNHFQNSMPIWYIKDFHVQYIDGMPCKTTEPFDFSFLKKYGKVFKVFDEQGSGNISFGVENGEKKYFVKFAGAPKENYISNRDSGAVDTISAIKMLKAAVPLYTELAHHTLIKFITAEDIGGGYAAVFEWEDAAGIEPYNSPDYFKFMKMPTEKKIRAFEDIMEFHAHIAAKGYVALDFYNGSILYDYDKEKVIICDIDLYQKSPFQNVGNLGIVGSAKYVSPEECAEDSIMDEITNVYTMGATAFALFALGDRSPWAWTLNKSLYNIAKKAVSDERSQRQQSIRQFIKEWEENKK